LSFCRISSVCGATQKWLEKPNFHNRRSMTYGYELKIGVAKIKPIRAKLQFCLVVQQALQVRQSRDYFLLFLMY